MSNFIKNSASPSTSKAPVDYNAKIQEAYKTLQEAAKSASVSGVQMVLKSVADLYKQRLEALQKNLQTPPEAEPPEILKKLQLAQANLEILTEKKLSPDEEVAKEKAEREFKDLTKRFIKSEAQLAVEKNLQKNSEVQKSVSENLKYAEQARQMLSQFERANANTQKQIQKQATQRAGHEELNQQFKALMQNKKPINTTETHSKSAQFVQKNALPQDGQNKKPLESADKEDLSLTEMKELAEAFDGEASKLSKNSKTTDEEVGLKDKDLSAEDSTNLELETPSDLDTEKALEANASESMMLVQKAIASGALVVKTLDPKCDLKTVMNELLKVKAELHEKTLEESDGGAGDVMQASAMMYCFTLTQGYQNALRALNKGTNSDGMALLNKELQQRMATKSSLQTGTIAEERAPLTPAEAQRNLTKLTGDGLKTFDDGAERVPKKETIAGIRSYEILA